MSETPKIAVERLWKQSLKHENPLEDFIDTICWVDWQDRDLDWFKKFVKLATKKIRNSVTHNI
jgi:hypothetical protein